MRRREDAAAAMMSGAWTARMMVRLNPKIFILDCCFPLMLERCKISWTDDVLKPQMCGSL